MQKIYLYTTKLRPIVDSSGRGNPWVQRWHYNDGSHRDVVVGAFQPYRPRLTAQAAAPTVTQPQA